MKHDNDTTLNVVLSKAQIHEILFAIEGKSYPSHDLKTARKRLQAMIKESKASNDSNPEGKTA